MTEYSILLGQVDNLDIDLGETRAVYMSPETQIANITPTTEKQQVLPDENKYFSEVNVDAVTADIDSNIVPENIKLGATILGVQGNVAPDKPDQTKTVVPTEEEQVVRADTGYELGECIVKPIPSQYEDVTDEVQEQNGIVANLKTIMQGAGDDVYYTADATATANDIASGKTAYVGSGKVTGTGSKDDIFQPNSTWWDIEKILEEDTDTEYNNKAIYLIDDTSDTEVFELSQWDCNQKIKTSDGSEYEYSTTSSVTHVWNKEFDKPCFVNGKKLYGTRYYIVLTKRYYHEKLNKPNILYSVIQTAEASLGTGAGAFQYNYGCYEYKILTFCLGYCGFGNAFINNSSLRKIIFNNIEPYSSTCIQPYTSSMFKNCYSLEQILGLDLKYCTDTSYGDGGSQMLYNCYNLRDLEIKNISFPITIGSTQYGYKLSLESLLNTIKELWDMSSDTEKTYTLTMGSINTAKIANIYVKLIDITDEMRTEDEYIDKKKPFEVCSSTTDGAMTIQEYVTSKNWQLA